MNHGAQTKLVCIAAFLLVLSVPLIDVIQARPSYAAAAAAMIVAPATMSQ